MRPELPVGHVVLFAVLLTISVAFQVMISPRRRALMGPVKFTLAAALEYGVPMFGVVVLRAGFRHAYEHAGWNWWAALFLSLLWMTVFIACARAIAAFVPPLSWLTAEWRQARREGFRMLFGLGGRRGRATRPQAPRQRRAKPREAFRLVGGSSTAVRGTLDRSRPSGAARP